MENDRTEAGKGIARYESTVGKKIQHGTAP